MTVLHFTTIRDVAPQMSGHLDRFKTHEAFAAACRLVWIAAEHSGQGAMIDQQKADAIMNRAVEEEARKETYEWFIAPCRMLYGEHRGDVRYYVQRYIRDQRQGEVTRQSFTMEEAEQIAARWNAGEPIDLGTMRAYL